MIKNNNGDNYMINFKKYNQELNQSILEFEKNNVQKSFSLNENDPIVHSMKVKGKIFSQIDIDSEFENADLLDLLGYERIISCKKTDK